MQIPQNYATQLSPATIIFGACCLTTGLVHKIAIRECPCEGKFSLTNVEYPT